jgi:hypothetical protein
VIPTGNTITLDIETFSILTIFEKVEYSEISEEDPHAMLFDPTFIAQPDNSTKRQKTAFLRIAGTPVACTLSSTRCSATSPFTILVISENTSAARPDASRADVQEQIVKFLVTTAGNLLVGQSFSAAVSQTSEKLDDFLLHYLVIDRTHGEIWECPSETTFRLFCEAFPGREEEMRVEVKRVLTQLTAYGMSAMMRGCTTMMWGELDYQFCYELRFEDENGQVMEPTHVFTPPEFDDDKGSNYGLICDTLFQGHGKVTCLELMSVYRGKIQVKSAMGANQKLFRLFKQRR